MHNFKLFGGEAHNAYTHFPGKFKIPTYISIDDQYAEWYKERYKTEIDRKLFLPLLKALQGHPELGHLWEEKINSILLSDEKYFSPYRRVASRNLYDKSVQPEESHYHFGLAAGKAQ